MNRTKVKLNKLVDLYLSSVDICKALIEEVYHDYIKLKYQDKADPFYMDTVSFIVYMKIRDVFKHVTKDVFTDNIAKRSNCKLIGHYKKG